MKPYFSSTWPIVSGGTINLHTKSLADQKNLCHSSRLKLSKRTWHETQKWKGSYSCSSSYIIETWSSSFAIRGSKERFSLSVIPQLVPFTISEIVAFQQIHILWSTWTAFFWRLPYQILCLASRQTKDKYVS